jgi:Raf kinase inhibitor-like YbhB/YbcL family protein
MQLRSDSFNDGDFIPTQYALGKTSAEGKIDLSDNKSPHLAWSDLPDGSHWVLVDVAPNANIAEGAFSDGVTAKGKDGPEGPQGTRQGINDYTGWFAADPDMAGDYYGYDGPCPPFNDSIVHHYRFTAYALDVDRVAVDGKFTAADVLAAVDGHVLDEASLVAKYKINQSAQEL